MKARVFFLGCALELMLLAGLSGQVMMGQSPTPPGHFRIGLIGGVNHNSVAADMERFLAVPNDPQLGLHDFANSTGLAPVAGLQIEYSPIVSLLGAYLRISYDDRSITGCYSGAELDARMAYITVEPALRVDLFSSGWHLLVGPSALFNTTRTYSYHPRDGGGEGVRSIEDAEIANINKSVFGIWGGFGSDIRVSGKSGTIGWYVTPFIEASYLFDQFTQALDGNSDEEWNTLTVRGGVQVKLELAP